MTKGLAIILGVISIFSLAMSFVIGTFELPAGVNMIAMLGAAVALFFGNKLSVLFLAISAIAYILGGIYLAESYGISVFQLRVEFFVSSIIRVGLVILTVYLLWSVRHKKNGNSSTAAESGQPPKL